MAEVTKTAAADRVHKCHAGCWTDFWCRYFWCERFLTHQGFSGDNPSRMLVACSLVSLSAKSDMNWGISERRRYNRKRCSLY